MKKILLFSLLSHCFDLTAQDHPTCDGLRYRTDVFADVESTKGLKYGEGTTINGTFKELYLDVYEPVGDLAENRPAIVLAFGGSFIAGERSNLEWLCEAFARKGFVAVTIDYRLYDLPLFPLPTAEEMQIVVTKTISDMKAAIRFLREDAATENQFRVDPDLVFAGGISAGAIVAAHTAALDSTDTITPELMDIISANGGFDGNTSSNFQYSSEVQGLINFSGGLNDAYWIDADDPPIFSVHDEFDGTVPYAEGFASIFGFNIIYMEGSGVMHEVADSVGVNNSLLTIVGSNSHVSYFNANQAAGTLAQSAGFLHDLFCSPVSSVKGAVEKLSAVTVYPNPSAGQLFVKSEEAHDLLHLTLFNAIGQQTGSWENAATLDLSSCEAGVYFLKIEDRKTNASTMRKVLINR